MERQRELNKPEDEGLEVVDIDEKGRGVKARRDFQEGDFVCEYVGMGEYSLKCVNESNKDLRNPN